MRNYKVTFAINMSLTVYVTSQENTSDSQSVLLHISIFRRFIKTVLSSVRKELSENGGVMSVLLLQKEVHQTEPAACQI